MLSYAVEKLKSLVRTKAQLVECGGSSHDHNPENNSINYSSRRLTSSIALLFRVMLIR
jgi:hypothetical protein